MLLENALTNLTEVKDYYQFGNTRQIDDDLLEDLANRVTIMFQTYCGVTSFLLGDYTEIADGGGDSRLYVANIPIQSVTTLQYSSSWDWEDPNTVIDSSNYMVRDKLYIVGKGIRFYLGDSNYRVVYRAGYSSIPLDLKQVCIEEVIRRYNHRKDFDVIAKSLDDGSVTYTEKGLLTSTKEVLNKYRNNWVI